MVETTTSEASAAMAVRRRDGIGGGGAAPIQIGQGGRCGSAVEGDGVLRRGRGHSGRRLGGGDRAPDPDQIGRGRGESWGVGGAVGGVRVFPRGDMEGGLGRSGWMASWAVWPS